MTDEKCSGCDSLSLTYLRNLKVASPQTSKSLPPVLDQNCLKETPGQSFTHDCKVESGPKGEHDIRTVKNGISYGLQECEVKDGFLSPKVNNNEINYRDLRSELYLWCEKHGVLSETRSFLRKLIITSLSGKVRKFEKQNSLQKNYSPLLESLNLLVAEFLLHQECHYTLSVFASEVPLLGNWPNLATFISQIGEDDDTGIDVLFPKLDDRIVVNILNSFGFPSNSKIFKTAFQAYFQQPPVNSLLGILFELLSNTHKVQLIQKHDDIFIHNSEDKIRSKKIDKIYDVEWETCLVSDLLNANQKISQIKKLQQLMNLFYKTEASCLKQHEQEKYYKTISECNEHEQHIVSILAEVEENIKKNQEKTSRNIYVKEARLRELATQLHINHEKLKSKLINIQDFTKEEKKEEPINSLQLQEVVLPGDESEDQSERYSHSNQEESSPVEKKTVMIQTDNFGLQKTEQEDISHFLSSNSIMLKDQLLILQFIQNEVSKFAEKEPTPCSVKGMVEDKCLGTNVRTMDIGTQTVDLPKPVTNDPSFVCSLDHQLYEENSDLKALVLHQQRRIDVLTKRSTELCSLLEKRKGLTGVKNKNVSLQTNYENLLETQSNETIQPVSKTTSNLIIKEKLGSHSHHNYTTNWPKRYPNHCDSCDGLTSHTDLHSCVSQLYEFLGDETSFDKTLQNSKAELNNLFEEHLDIDKQFENFQGTFIEKQNTLKTTETPTKLIFWKHLLKDFSSFPKERHLNMSPDLGFVTPTFDVSDSIFYPCSYPLESKSKDFLSNSKETDFGNHEDRESIELIITDHSKALFNMKNKSSDTLSPQKFFNLPSDDTELLKNHPQPQLPSKLDISLVNCPEYQAHSKIEEFDGLENKMIQSVFSAKQEVSYQCAKTNNKDIFVLPSIFNGTQNKLKTNLMNENTVETENIAFAYSTTPDRISENCRHGKPLSSKEFCPENISTPTVSLKTVDSGSKKYISNHLDEINKTVHSGVVLALNNGFVLPYNSVEKKTETEVDYEDNLNELTVGENLELQALNDELEKSTDALAQKQDIKYHTKIQNSQKESSFPISPPVIEIEHEACSSSLDEKLTQGATSEINQRNRPPPLTVPLLLQPNYDTPKEEKRVDNKPTMESNNNTSSSKSNNSSEFW